MDSCVDLKMPNSPIMTGRTDNVQDEMQNEQNEQNKKAVKEHNLTPFL